MSEDRRVLLQRSIDAFLRCGVVEARAGSWVAVESLYERLVENCTIERLPLPSTTEMLELLAEKGYPGEDVGRGWVVMGLALRLR